MIFQPKSLNFHNLLHRLSYFRRFSTKISVRDCRDLHYLALHEIGECFSGNRRTESTATRRTEPTKTYVSWNRFPKVRFYNCFCLDLFVKSDRYIYIYIYIYCFCIVMNELGLMGHVVKACIDVYMQCQPLS